MSAAAIQLDRVSVSFGGVHAVRECTFTIEEGSITGLIGPNGAGKSTVISLIGGALQPDSGDITFFGECSPGMAHLVADRGVARTFQIPQEMRQLTVMENLLVSGGAQTGEGVLAALFGRSSWRRQEEESLDRAWALLKRFRLDHLANDLAVRLSGGQKKLLEFARALHARPRVLLLDEPMAGVNPTLRSSLEEHIASFHDEGITVLMIEHEMGIVSRLCSKVVVMAEGHVIAEGGFEEISQDERVISAYLGQTVKR